MANGNAYLITQGPKGQIKTSFWLGNLQTGATYQMSENQLHTGVSYIPIRRNEQNLSFSALWNMKDFDQMEYFSFLIQQHWNITVFQGKIIPMALHYFTSQLPIYNGWILSAQRGGQRFQTVYTRDYNMRLIMPLRENTATVQSTSTTAFIPTAKTVNEYGAGWYNIQNIPATTAPDINYFSSKPTTKAK